MCVRQAGCQSVYAAARGLVSRDEWAVPRNSQISSLTLKGYAESGRELPYWCWPDWVHALGGVVRVDMAAVDRVSAAAASMAAGPSAQTYGVRVNAAGRPIHDDGRFMSYAEARSRGWGGTAAQNPWNKHQQSLGGQGHSRQQLSDGYRGSTSTSQPSSSSTRRSNAWNEHQRSMGGRGYTREEMRATYNGGSRRGQPSQAAPARPSTAPTSSASSTRGTGRAPNPWNEHQRAMGGLGLSRSQMQSSYRTSHSPSMGGSTGRAPNPWNEHQRAMGGLGLSRAQMQASYHASHSPSMGMMGLGGGGMSLGGGGGGGGLSWNAFRSSVAGQGMSRSEMSSAYWAQK